MLEKLLIENFKCLSEAEIELKAVNLLAGLNGMGKSSVLQSLLLLHQSFEATRTENIEALVLNGALVNVGTAADALWEGADTDALSLGFVANSEEYRWIFGIAEGEDELQAIGSPVTPVPLNHGLFTDDFHYLRAERSGPRSAYPVSYTDVRQKNQIGRDGELAPFFLATYGTAPLSNRYLEHPDAASPQLRHQLEAWLGEISPGTRIYTQTHTDLDLVALEYAFASALGETKHFRSTNVGFGITYILPVVLRILSAPPGSLVLLENPEAHLHPKGQTKMGELLGLASKGGVQLLIETHSDHLLNGVRLAVHAGQLEPDNVGLLFFQRVQDGGGLTTRISSPKMDRAGRLDSWPDGFFDESEKTLRQLLVPPS